ncbi:hypothetical protein JOC34_000570 [Virgibacillus halotolerans]|uniref:hypothetical protein n=1 Tax=Virgibacillus halotolerans TaxID=1071053 RepID=UPI00195F3AC4|nr:hypothetical protein [Virgibacillus halotolerans]MBM7598213.1 hypothetical protein [Virgibacillus halotolerans]
MELKRYTHRHEMVIREQVGLYVEKVADGIYLIKKDRLGSKSGQFINSDTLFSRMGHYKKIAIDDESGITAIFDSWE